MLRGCGTSIEFEPDLKRCAELLNGKLQQDGYVNSRVYTEKTSSPGQLTVVMGRLVELHVDSDEPRLSQRVRQQLKKLIGRTLHLPTLQRQLRQLKQRSVVGSVSGTLGSWVTPPRRC